MTVRLSTPDVAAVPGIVEVMRSWPVEGAPVQLHPGDLGWLMRSGVAATAAALRTWHRDGNLVAVGMVDGAGLVRWTASALDDRALAEQVAADLADADRGVLPAGDAAVETPPGSALQGRLRASGWTAGEAWTPLRRDLADPVDDPGVWVEVVRVDDSAAVADYTAVHRSAFASPRLTDEAFLVMAEAPAYRHARSLLARDVDGAPVAEVTVWSAGPGRPGLLEPMGVHADRRGRGYGRAICLAAAAALRDLGASSAHVCTPSANVGGVATYRAAGYAAQPERLDLVRTVVG